MFFGTLFYENKDLILKYDFIIRETGTGQGRIQTSLHSLWGIVGTSNCGIGRRYLSKKFLFILFYYVAWKLTYQLKWLRVHCTLLDIEQNFYTSPPLPPHEFTFIYPPLFKGLYRKSEREYRDWNLRILDVEWYFYLMFLSREIDIKLFKI